jgi:hypothetical protein
MFRQRDARNSCSTLQCGASTSVFPPGLALKTAKVPIISTVAILSMAILQPAGSGYREAAAPRANLPLASRVMPLTALPGPRSRSQNSSGSIKHLSAVRSTEGARPVSVVHRAGKIW